MAKRAGEANRSKAYPNRFTIELTSSYETGRARASRHARPSTALDAPPCSSGYLEQDSLMINRAPGPFGRRSSGVNGRGLENARDRSLLRGAASFLALATLSCGLSGSYQTHPDSQEGLSQSVADATEAQGQSGTEEFPERPFAQPTGPYPAGVQELQWTDSSRAERFTKDPSDFRQIRVRVWYPAAGASGGDAPYLPDAKEFSGDSALLAFQRVRAPAALGAPPASGSFPVLLYSHGGGWTRFASTFTTLEMASHGYVVFSIGHNGFNRSRFGPDGRSTVPDTLLFPEPSGDLARDARASWAYLEEHHFPEWVADSRFVLDRILAGDVGESLADRLDAERIGAYGWSFGGAAAFELLVVDERVDAAANHDGQLFGRAPSVGSTKPYLLFRANETPEPPAGSPDPEEARAALNDLIATVKATDASFMSASSGPGLALAINGASHGSFSDLVLFQFGGAPALSPRRGHEIINAWTLAFFNKRLKGEQSGLLDGADSGSWPEVKVERRPQ